ncbi:hypothetical protein GCM10010402_69380 [Actinomadura luteofluorescens]
MERLIGAGHGRGGRRPPLGVDEPEGQMVHAGMERAGEQPHQDALVARGLSNTEIADHLHLSLATVKTYIGRLLTKLRARDRAQLVIIAYESGLAGAAG